MSAADWKRKLRLKAAGLCTICAKNELQTVWRCADCAKRHRIAKRKQKREQLGCKPWKKGGPGRPPIDADGDTGLHSLPGHLRKQLDGKSTRIVCSWADWLEYSEAILATQPIERIKLTDWPEIDLGDTRRQAMRAIAREYDGRFVFELPDEVHEFRSWL